MEKINFLLFLLFCCFLFAFDIYVNRCSFIADGKLRVLSEVAVLAVMSEEFFHNGFILPDRVYVACLALGNSFLLVIPSSYGSITKPAAYIIAASLGAMLAISPLAGLPDLVPEAVILTSLSVLVLTVNLVSSAFERFTAINLILKKANVAQTVTDMERMLYSLVFCLLVSFFLIGGYLPWEWCRRGEKCAALLFLLLFGLNYYMACTGRGCIFENRVLKLKNSGSDAGAEPANTREPKLSMETLYMKILSYMEEKKPFLDEKFCLGDMAAALGTNKAYVSKTVNVMYGNNFCQFINYYRIQYAADLMKKDRRLKVLEVSMMSGFHSVASFNMAFKLFMNDLPSEFTRNYHSKSLSIPEGLEP